MKNEKPRKILPRIIICVLIIVFGLLVMKVLTGLKKPPTEAQKSETALQVEAITVEKNDYPVSITGYGEVRALKVVPIAPEIAGKVIAIHPRLELGEIIPQGEVLFQIDSQDYQTAVTTGRARLKILKKSQELATKEFERISSLFEKNQVGTASGVDRAEKALLASKDMVLQVDQALKMAQTNLDRCQVRAKFDGRVSQVALEAGQFVAPGQPVLTLVDDARLEIQVSLDSRVARNWLQFGEAQTDRTPSNWFANIKQAPCSIHWTEANDGQTWNGRLDRVVGFDPKTRTLTVAVRLEPTTTEAFPLVAGMFCRVNLPGQPMLNVVRLPRKAVSFDNMVYTAINNRLQTVSVTVVREEGDFIFVSAGLNQDDQVITTRLINPLENILLKIVGQQIEEVEGN